MPLLIVVFLLPFKCFSIKQMPLHMKKIMQCAVLVLFVATSAGCSVTQGQASNGLFGGNVISVMENAAANPNAVQQKYAASIRLLPYRDMRKTENPNRIGISTQRVIGMSGTELMVEPEVAAIVTNSMRKHLDDAGFQLDATNALYELSGVVKELNYDVKVRDEIYIVVESTLKDSASGKVLWSGSVVEKSDRFAGVSGNSKQDIANYLREKVGVVTGKTTEGISTSLMASRPDLFNLTPGTRPIAGVTVLVAPAANVLPTSAKQKVQPIVPSVTPAPLDAESGLLLITSTPARAGIYIDDVYYGMTPLRLELAAGVHSVSARFAAHKSNTEKVSVRKGETTEFEVVPKR